MSDYKERMVEEVKELRVKIAKLHDFIYESDDFLPLDFGDKDRMIRQLTYMEGYEQVLSDRIMNL